MSGPMPPRQLRSQRTLQRILDGAYALLATKDVDAISVEELAQAAGVSVGALYTRFRSKEALFAHLLNSLQARHVANLRDAVAGGSCAGLDLEGRVDWMIVRLRAAARDRPGLVRAFFQSLTDARAPGAGETAKGNGASLGLLAELLLERRAEIHAPQPERAAHIAAAQLCYMVQLADLYPASFLGMAAEDVIPHIKRSVLTGLKSPHP